MTDYLLEISTFVDLHGIKITNMVAHASNAFDSLDSIKCLVDNHSHRWIILYDAILIITEKQSSHCASREHSRICEQIGEIVRFRLNSSGVDRCTQTYAKRNLLIECALWMSLTYVKHKEIEHTTAPKLWHSPQSRDSMPKYNTNYSTSEWKRQQYGSGTSPK